MWGAAPDGQPRVAEPSIDTMRCPRPRALALICGVRGRRLRPNLRQSVAAMRRSLSRVHGALRECLVWFLRLVSFPRPRTAPREYAGANRLAHPALPTGLRSGPPTRR